MQVGNNAIFANATKKGVVISYTLGTPNVLSIYDKDNETLAGVSTDPESLTAWANGDTIYLFSKTGVAVLGAFSVTISVLGLPSGAHSLEANDAMGVIVIGGATDLQAAP